jgi:hypothetical protein
VRERKGTREALRSVVYEIGRAQDKYIVQDPGKCIKTSLLPSSTTTFGITIARNDVL